MGGAAPVVDGSGHIWVSTGNGSVYSVHARLRRQRSVLELSLIPAADAVLRAGHVGHEQLPGPGHVRRAGAAARRPGAAGREIPDRLSARRRSPGRHRPPGSHPGCQRARHHGVGLQRRHRRRRRGRGHDGLPALPGGHHRGPGHQFPARAAPAVEFRRGRRPAHRGGGPGLDHRAERRAVRARPGDREGATAGHDRRCRPIISRLPAPATASCSPPAQTMWSPSPHRPPALRPRPRVRHSILAARPTPRRPRLRRLRTFASATSLRPPSARPW